MSDRHDAPSIDPTDPEDSGRRESVLESAMATFARFGYRKTSMDEIAQAAHISRPGLYFLFGSKQALFREAVTRALGRDLDAIARELDDTARPLNDRILGAFDRWGGSYVGPLSDELAATRDDPAGLGTILTTAPQRFADLVTAAIAEPAPGTDAAARAATIISASIGIKHQVGSREAYSRRLAIAADLILP